MKFATLPGKTPGKNRQGELLVVSKDLSRAAKLPSVPNLLFALENWKSLRSELERAYQSLNAGTLEGSQAFEPSKCIAPLPFAPGFYDGSAFLSHVARARASRGDKMPESAKVTPLMYQGVSDNLLPATSPLELMDESFGGDFEGEFAVITTDVPRGTPASEMDPYIALITFFNDTTYREVLKTEIQTKFGFLQSKPNSSFAPIVLTPDELGNNWKDGRVLADVVVKLNGELFGSPNGKEMNFSFQELVSHACRTRPLGAGSIIGSGTVSNEDKTKGFACLTEKRFQEILDTGSPQTPWLKAGDQVHMDAVHAGQTLFGSIDQQVVV